MVSSLQYYNFGWDINLPSVEAYSYSQKDIDRFMKEGKFPLACDTNLITACNAHCLYCATKGGKEEDPRFTTDLQLPIPNDNELSEMIHQLDLLGTRSFFLCSTGEPLLDSPRFLRIIDGIGNREIKIVTYTNASTLNRSLLQELHKRKISLVMKLESLNPRLNDNIIFRRNIPKGIARYRYGTLEGEKIPSGIIDAFEVYGKDRECLAVESMVLNQNLQGLLEIREWAYQCLGISQFLKQVYPLGEGEIDQWRVIPSLEDKEKLSSRILELDARYGFKYPSIKQAPERYSYDARRFLNNARSLSGFPFRTFTHQIGGVYQSGEASSVNFGFGTANIISIFDSSGNVNMREYCSKIEELIKEQDKWKKK